MQRTVLRCATDVKVFSPSIQEAFGKRLKGECFHTTALEPSIIPTHHLSHLPRLPIPKLADTCRRYELAITPLLAPKHLESVKKTIHDFANGPGLELQHELVATDKRNKHTSYISADWFHIYLKDRTPLPVNYNPLLVMRRDYGKKDPLVRTAFIITSTVKWYRMFREGTLKPEVFFFAGPSHYSRSLAFTSSVALCPKFLAAKYMMVASKFHAFPLDMSQYPNLFCSTRIPKLDVDVIEGFPYAPHIVVLHRGHYFKVTVSDHEGYALPEEQIYSRLKQIVDGKPAEAEVDVGMYTAMKRQDWAAVRTSMMRSEANTRSIKCIDTAMFLVALDTDVSTTWASQPEMVASTRHMLAGRSNRWWDKPLSFIVTKEGDLGVSFEHAWGDGVAVLRSSVDIFNDSIMRSADGFTPVAATEPVQQLEWKLSPEEKATAAVAQKEHNALVDRMDFSLGVVPFGKKVLALRHKVRADTLMQQAMQLAYWRLNQATVSTYESASTAAFLRGRTEVIRSATIESQQLVTTFDKPTATKAEKISLLVKAAHHHAALSKAAKMGGGIDRHLFALSKVAERRFSSRPKPEIFTDPSYATFGSNILSTSSLYSDALIAGGFGPVSAGYGLAYAAADNEMAFNVSCWKSGGQCTTLTSLQALSWMLQRTCTTCLWTRVL